MMVRVTQGVKSVKQNVSLSPRLLELMETFRLMVNDAGRIGLQENVTALKSLSVKTYRQLAKYHVPSRYKASAISTATGILRNYRRMKREKPETKTPYAKKLMLTTYLGFKIDQGILTIPCGDKEYDREYEYVALNKHTLDVLSQPDIRIRSITLTPQTLGIVYSKEVVDVEPSGLIGIDRNLDNVAIATLEGGYKTYDLSEATQIKAKYREVKSHFKRNDARIGRKIFGKYGRKQRNKVGQILNCVSKAIVEEAKAKGFGIVMENLKGIRKLYRKGNGQSRNYRAKLNGWSFYELQRQIEYKAKWQDIKVIYVPPHGTSSNCAICGSHVTECAERLVLCPTHGFEDRDVNAAKNIAARGMRFVPVGSPGEAMVASLQQGAKSMETR